METKNFLDILANVRNQGPTPTRYLIHRILMSRMRPRHHASKYQIALLSTPYFLWTDEAKGMDVQFLH